MKSALPDKLAAALLAAVCGSVVCAIALATALAGLSPRTAIASLAFGLACGAATFVAVRPGPSRMPNAWDILLLAVFSLASLRAFLWVLYSVGDEWRVLSPYNLGDMSLHIQFIRYFASGIPFWPESPILAGAPLSYPPGADLFNSLLLLAGIPLREGLVWCGLLGAALSAFALWRWGGAFALAALLFNGGIAGFAILRTGAIQDFQSELAWKNLFLTMLVPQRGLLYALPCGLLLLRAWRDDFFGPGSGIPRPVQFALYSTLPLFNIHAFLFLSLALAAIFLTEKTSRKTLLAFVGAALAPGTLCVWLSTGGFAASAGLRWLPGWMQGDAGALFWIVNFGIALPLLAALYWKALRRGDPATRAFCAVSLAVFLLCFFFAFAPWEWDNTKLLLWAWLAAAPFLWTLVLAPMRALPRAIFCILLFFSGAVSLVGGLDTRHGYGLAKRSELAAAETALLGISPNARIAIKNDYNHPVILLGRPVVCGYEGHLWSHGLPYREKLKLLENILALGPGHQADARQAGADLIYLRTIPPQIIPVLEKK
jgi:hypothetical protein